MQVIIDGLAVNYIEEGKGRPLLMLHGWGSSLATFSGLIKDFSKGYRVLAVDLPGFGATQMPARPWGLADYADFTAKFLAKLDIKPYAVIGHSNGGAVAIKGLGGGYLTAEKLVLLGSSGIRPKERGRKLVLLALTKAGKLATIALPAATRKKIRGRYYAKIGSDYRITEGMEETFKQTVAEDVLKDAARLELPVLLIYGEEDPATPPLLGELFRQEIPSASLEVIGGAGHFVHEDVAAKVQKSIKEFLA